MFQIATCACVKVKPLRPLRAARASMYMAVLEVFMMFFSPLIELLYHTLSRFARSAEIPDLITVSVDGFYSDVYS